MMKKSVWMTMGLATALCVTAATAQDDAPAKKDDAAAVSNSCKNKVQVTEVSGTMNGGGKTFDYFMSIKNPTDKVVFVDVKYDNFPGATHLYSPIQKDVKVKPGKTQTIRFGNGTNNNMSVASLTIQVDKDKPGKKPTVSLVNCRDTK